MDIKGSKTETNLMTAFSGECMARVKYEEYAARLEEGGNTMLAARLRVISGQERTHAALILRLLEEGEQSAADMLDDVCAGERFESEELYPSFSVEAEREGFPEIAELFRSIAAIERRHAEEVETLGAASSEDTACDWRCHSCGHVYTGATPTAVCPVCGAKMPFGKF